MLERTLPATVAKARRETAAQDVGGRGVTIFDQLTPERLQAMLEAGDEINECYRVLRKTDANVVSEVLKGQGTFYEWDHYPQGDVFDQETHSQYYYHAHRSETGEHGHFHTFLRAEGFPPDTRPVPYDGTEAWPTGEDALCHLIAIAMDKRGYPTHLFTTNRWVTGESFHAADDVVAMLDRFEIDHAYPSWPTNRWLNAMLRLFQPQIAILLHQRDGAIERWREAHPDRDVYEDRELEITSSMPISVTQQLKQVRKRLKRQGIG